MAVAKIENRKSKIKNQKSKTPPFAKNAHFAKFAQCRQDGAPAKTKDKGENFSVVTHGRRLAGIHHLTM